MPERIFLGYDSPLLPKLAASLLVNRDDLPETLVIVPTTQSGRTLREALAASADSLLAPRVVTPGALLHPSDSRIAIPWVEKLAWIETLQSLPNSRIASLSGLFPIPPDSTTDWAVPFAAEMVALRTRLQEQSLDFFAAARLLSNSPDASRWKDLASLETDLQQTLGSWNLISRSEEIRKSHTLPSGCSRIILAAVADLPGCVSTALLNSNLPVTVLIAAPASEAHRFSPLGIPLESWATALLPASASITIAGDSTAQAASALAAASSISAPSDQFAIGSADDRTSTFLADTFSKAGWPAFDPAAIQPPPPLARWLSTWAAWLSKPDSRTLAALLTCPESAVPTGGDRARISRDLNQLRDKHPIADPQELALLSSDRPHLARAIGSLLSLREHFIRKPFPQAVGEHIAALGLSADHPESTLATIADFLETAAPLTSRIDRSNSFWLALLLAELPAPPPEPPENRAIDIQGWLELLYEPGPHLIICGLNESFIPSRPGGEPWLSENVRKILGLPTDASRHARDSYLLHTMIRMRESSGSSLLICGKHGPAGEAFLPSRLLLQVPDSSLVRTVKNLFRQIAPPGADAPWDISWKWSPPSLPLRTSLGVTALSDYLACPFRFYLKHIARMASPEPDRREMNARDFGNIIHKVLENWGNNPEARALTDPRTLTSFFHSELDRITTADFGPGPPLAIRIQYHALLQRLEWVAAWQAEAAAAGWNVLATERKFRIPMGKITLKATIDRIDQHRDTGAIRLIDYKTGRIRNAEHAHRRKIEARTNVPPHLEAGGPAFQTLLDPKGWEFQTFWTDLQLPLYALVWLSTQDPGTPLPTPAYFLVGSTAADTGILPWDSFSMEDLVSAESCARWITTAISSGHFQPPAEKVTYDDFAIFSHNRPLAEGFNPISLPNS